MAKTKDLNLYVAVGCEDGPRSSVWHVLSRGHQVFIAPGGTMGIAKITLHQDRTCQYKPSREHRRRMDELGIGWPARRPVARWMRPETPRQKPATALLITIPAEGLRDTGDVPERRIEWLPPAPAGQAVKIAVTYTFAKAPSYRLDGGWCLGHAHLDNGETVILFARHCPFDAEAHFGRFRQPQSGTPQWLTKEGDFRGRGDLRMILFGEPPDVGTFEVLDVALHKNGYP